MRAKERRWDASDDVTDEESSDDLNHRLDGVVRLGLCCLLLLCRDIDGHGPGNRQAAVVRQAQASQGEV